MRAKLLSSLLVATFFVAGCSSRPTLVAPKDRRAIDRSLIEFPAGFELQIVARGLTGPVAIAFDDSDPVNRGSILIAESGNGGDGPRIYGFKPDGTRFDVYPRTRSFPLNFFGSSFEISAPIGGMVVHNGHVIITHRQRDGTGAITSLDYSGGHETLIAGLPAQGDYGVTDLAVNPSNGRIYFGIGSATNSGVVGLDNWEVGWVERYPGFSDVPWIMLKLLGNRFDTKNPRGGLFGGSDLAVTGPFQPFNTSNQSRIKGSAEGKPGSAIYSMNAGGGDLRVEAHGVRMPRGLAFNEFSNLFFTNDGMEMRGTRPVKDDPDALLRLVPGTWYGFPDYSGDLYPITESRFQPPMQMIVRTGYPELSFLIDHDASSLTSPAAFRDNLLRAAFASLSGAAKLDFVPSSGAFKEFRGNAIVALAGDRSPFANSGVKLNGPVGFKVVRVDVDPGKRLVKEFLQNAGGKPASMLGRGSEDALERPCDVKFAPDGSMYILDLGQMIVKNGREQISNGTGKLYKLTPVAPPASQASR